MVVHSCGRETSPVVTVSVPGGEGSGFGITVGDPGTGVMMNDRNNTVNSWATLKIG